MSLQGWQQKADTYVASPYVLSMVLGALVCLFFRVEVTGAEPNSLMRTSQLKLWVLEEGRVTERPHCAPQCSSRKHASLASSSASLISSCTMPSACGGGGAGLSHFGFCTWQSAPSDFDTLPLHSNPNFGLLHQQLHHAQQRLRQWFQVLSQTQHHVMQQDAASRAESCMALAQGQR